MTSGGRRFLGRALVALGAALALLILAGLGLRAWADARFEPDPEPVPGTAVPDTALVGAVRARLADQGPGLTERFSPLADASRSLEARIELARAAGATLDVQYYGFHHDASGLALLDALEAARGARRRGAPARRRHRHRREERLPRPARRARGRSRGARVQPDGAARALDAASAAAEGPAELPGLDVWQGLDGAARESFPASVAVTVDPWDKVLAPFASEPEDSAAAVVDLMRSTEEVLRVSSPYFIPGEQGMEVMTDLRARGVEVVVMTNSQASTDVPAVFAAYREWRKPMLELGVELYEFLPAMAPGTDWSGLSSDSTSLHAKNLVIDDRAVFVGSVNLDARSFFHNTEMGVVLESEAFGAEMQGNWDAQLPLVAWRLILGDDGRVRWHETLPDGGERVHLVDPGTTRLDRGVARVLSWLPVAWLL